MLRPGRFGTLEEYGERCVRRPGGNPGVAVPQRAAPPAGTLLCLPARRARPHGWPHLPARSPTVVLLAPCPAHSYCAAKPALNSMQWASKDHRMDLRWVHDLWVLVRGQARKVGRIDATAGRAGPGRVRQRSPPRNLWLAPVSINSGAAPVTPCHCPVQSPSTPFVPPAWACRGSCNLPELHRRLGRELMIRRLKQDVRVCGRSAPERHTCLVLS